MEKNLIEMAKEINLQGGNLSSSNRYVSKRAYFRGDDCDCYNGDCSDCYCIDCNEGND